MGESETVIALPGLGDVRPFGAVVVLHVTGAALGRELPALHLTPALELREDRLVRPPHGVGQHVEPAAVGHADHHVACARGGRPLDGEVEHGHQHVHAFDREPLLAEVALVEEFLQRLHLGQAPKQRALFLGRERLPVRARLDLLPQPDPLLVGSDVLDLVGHRAAVGGLEIRERLGQRPARDRDAQHLGGDRRHDLGREAERAGVERRVADRWRAQGIEVGGQVPVHAEGLDQRHRRAHVVEHVGRDRSGGLVPFGGGRGLDDLIAHRGELEALVDLLVEPVGALQQVLDGGQELPRLGALDDAVVVGARDGHDLADAELLEALFGHGGELDRIADRADRDDAALTGHQPRHRGYRAEPAGVGERHRGAREVVGHEAVAARLLDQGLVGGVERGEIHRLRALDDGDDQPAAAILPLYVHRESERDALGLHPVRHPLVRGEGVSHDGVFLGRLNQRERDEVGEGDFVLAPGGLERAVDPPPPLFQCRDRHHPEGGGRRYSEALLHVGDELGGWALDGGGT